MPLSHAGRSTVFNALLALMKTIPATSIPGQTVWKTITQSLVLWDEIPAVSQPAMLLHRGPQISEQKHVFGVTKQEWHASIWIYFRTDSLKTASTYPDQITDQMLDSFELAFQTDPINNRLTLGGVCYHCFIDGTIFFDSGINDQQAVIVVPITILV
jgi:hypothetical protein